MQVTVKAYERMLAGGVEGDGLNPLDLRSTSVLQSLIAGLPSAGINTCMLNTSVRSSSGESLVTAKTKMQQQQRTVSQIISTTFDAAT